ncbi:hypothetical protein P168DRAFT_284323 [Aspergillus campestris IBT 28561]|uniref:ARM repeat-containing protein n=1 Tax=Aspergillus campestris (strain IBT 28561) TaxID=1392248 RepID=A0A2I1CVC7_ASPC2|nr:uncharacterized protein P168DRAFT_284323 [Aspergillus campestris IBT 28561]PKY01569.1 hypothetical protein P168DRAFT_284323 [Aspergillus campestris IBT 28561]
MNPSTLHHLTTTPLGHPPARLRPSHRPPNQLRALQSPDKQARTDAYNQLYSNIYHQSDRYEATAHAVPYILNILSNPAAPDRPRLLCLLLDLALGIPAEVLPLGVRLGGTCAGGVSMFGMSRTDGLTMGSLHYYYNYNLPPTRTLNQPHLLIRWAAAVALTRLEHHAPEHVNVITQALTDPSFIPAEYHAVFPFCEGDFSKYSAKILRGLDMNEYPGVVPAVLETLPGLPRPDALNLAEVAMELALGAMPDDEDDDDEEEEEEDNDDDGVSVERMSALQRRTVMALAEWDDDEA